MEDLYKAIITTAVEDLFDQSTDEERHNRYITWRWFNYTEGHYDDRYVTFLDACDLANFNSWEWKEIARKVYTGIMPYKEYLEKKSKLVERVVKHPTLLTLVDLPINPMHSAVRKFHTLEDANLYNAML
jgi:hypothetical protein